MIQPALKKSNTIMNITYENVDVTTPFFHENNTTMNSYEAPVEPETTAEQSKPMQWCPCEAAASKQSNPEQSSLAETASLGENTIFHAIQASISHSAHRKQYIEECPFQLGGRHPACKAISNNIEREHEKIEKSREITRQFFRPKRPMKDTNPVPWRWENRTAVPVKERGACLLYRPVTYKMIQPTPFCLLHENDVVDNGTVMCLQLGWGECVYGNETMKAMLEIDRFYRSEIKFPAIKFPEIKFPEFPEFPVTWFLILFFIVVGALQKGC